MKFGIRNNSSDEYTGFKVQIDKLSLQSVSGIVSFAVDEFRWFNNGWQLNNLSQGQSKNIFFFKDAFLCKKQLTSLTVRVAIYLH